MSSAEPAASLPHESGAQFLDEIREQPEALLRLLERQSAFVAVADEMRRRDATTIRMVGHGSSDNAASYGVYAFGLLPGWTALRDSISLTVYYGAELDMSGCTALALSQSGRTPDVVRARDAAHFQHGRRWSVEIGLQVEFTHERGPGFHGFSSLCYAARQSFDNNSSNVGSPSSTISSAEGAAN